MFDFSTQQTFNFQLDLPIFRKSYIFQAFKILNPLSAHMKTYKKNLVEFYDTYSQDPGLVWSHMPILEVVRVEKLCKFKDLFFNYQVVVKRGEQRDECAFTFADLPHLNPLDWFNVWKLVSLVQNNNNSEDVLNVRDHMIQMSRCYIRLVAGVDHEVARALGSKIPEGTLKPAPKEDISDAQIIDEPWGLITVKDKKFFFMPIEEIFVMKNDVFQSMLTRIALNSKNNASTFRNETIIRFRWWMEVRKILVEIAKYFKDN